MKAYKQQREYRKSLCVRVFEKKKERKKDYATKRREKLE